MLKPVAASAVGITVLLLIAVVSDPIPFVNWLGATGELIAHLGNSLVEICAWVIGRIE